MVNIIEARIYPKFMAGAILYHPKPSKIKFKEILILSSTFNKKFTFATILSKVEKSEDSQIYLHVDKNKSGILENEDKIDIIDFKIPIADVVTILVNNTLHVPEGNWGTYVTEQIMNEIYDIGEELTFVYPGTNPIIIESTIKSSLPSAPIKIGKNTKIIVEKKDDEEIIHTKFNSLIEIKERVDSYKELLKAKLFDMISAIKSDDTENITQEFSFDSNAESVIKGIPIIFKDWEKYYDTVEIDENHVNASYDYFLRHKNKIKAFVNLRILSKNNLGSLKVTVYTLEKKPEKLLKQIVKDMEILTFTAKDRLKLINDNCPACGATVNIYEIDENNHTRCDNCDELIDVPPKYRYP